MKLTAAKRKAVPKSKMGLPGKATKKGGAVRGTYPMPDSQHASLAKSYASRFASRAQEKVIDRKANAILGKKGAKKK